MKKDALEDQGFSLVELLVAMLLLTMVSTMIYSVLNVGIKFKEQSDSHMVAMARKFGFIDLVHRQVKSALYDIKTAELMIWVNDDTFMLVNRNPYIYRDAGVVLAVYRYNAQDNGIYYLEKRDYYNVDYDQHYQPEFEEMVLLAKGEGFLITFDRQSSPEFIVEYQGREYAMLPKCVDNRALAELGL